MGRNVVHVTDYTTPYAGSFIPAIAALAQEAGRRGDAFTFVVPAISDEAEWPWRITAARAALRTVRSPAALFGAIQSLKPDIVHVHFNGYLVPATLAAIGARSRLFWHLHSAMSDAAGPVRRVLRRCKYRWLGSSPEAAIAVSAELGREMERWGTPASKIRVVANGVDTERFHAPSESERAEARRSLGIEPHERVLLFFGRDPFVKGGDVLEAALRLAPGFTVLAIGTPAANLARLAESARVVPVAIALDTVPLYWAADALVMPSRLEGAPLAMLEALCCGVPVVASDLPALAALGGRLPMVHFFSREDPRALAEVLRSPETFANCALAAADQRILSLDRWVERIYEIYDA